MLLFNHLHSLFVVCFLFSTCMAATSEVLEELVNKEYYFKVSDTLPEELMETKISQTYTGRGLAKYACLALCSRTDNCALACYDDDTCLLYSALVSKYWNPNGPWVQSTLVSLNMRCYSSWHFTGDVTTHITNARQSSIHTLNGLPCYPLLATNGFYSSGNLNSFRSEKEIDPWVEFQFDVAVKIKKIVIKIRANVDYSNFEDIDAKVGNESSADGSFNAFTSVGFYGGEPTIGDLVVFTLDSTIFGKFLAFKSRSGQSYAFSFGDLKVIS